jgi:hypothetical protein
MLDRVLLFAAAADGVRQPLQPHGEPSKLFGLSVRDALLLIGVAIIIGAALFLWAYLTRRRGRRHLARSPALAHTERHRRGEEPDRTRMRKRRRRQAEEEFPRNPTLGETGGLPPIRPDEPAQPAA